MNTLKTLTTAIAFASLSMAGTAVMAETAGEHRNQDGASGHSLTGHGATGEQGTSGSAATGSAASMQHGATGREAEGGHSMGEGNTGVTGGANQPRGDGAAAVGRQDAAGGAGQGAMGEQGTSGTPGGSGQNTGTGAATGAGATGAGAGTNTQNPPSTNSERAPGHSSMQQGGDDPARTADRPGVTGAPDEVERNQRDLPGAGSNTQSN